MSLVTNATQSLLRNEQAGQMMVGLAFGPGVPGLLDRNPGLVDYLELPFELLRHDPTSIRALEHAPVVLHCASMSIAGFVRPSEDTLNAIAVQMQRTRTPWIGEHMAFIAADSLETGATLHEPTTLTYTVCPQLSEEVLDLACNNLNYLQARFPVPLIVENSPQYFSIPGSTMSMTDFLSEVHRRTHVGMLLDLTHFMISSINMDFNPFKEITKLPLEHLVEMHVSGLDVQTDTAWDDHAGLADDRIFELAEIVFAKARPRAVTFEYNWAPNLPDEALIGQIERIRKMERNAR